MAYSKIILNGETLMDVTSDTVVAGSMTSGTTATKKDGTKITGTIVTKSAADLTASGSTVTVPGGYYSAQATKNVASVTHPNPTAAITSSTGVVTATHTQSAGYVAAGTTTGTTQLTTQAAQTINTSTADQTVASYRWLTGTQTIKSVTTSNLTAANIASGVVVKVGDANNASRITQVTGTYAPAVSSATVTPTETAQTLNATGVYGYKPVTINAISSTYVGTGVAKKSSADTTFASATGTFTAPIGYYSAAATKTLTTQAAQTIYPSTADQTVASYRWLTGTQTFKSVTTTNLTAANIASGVVVKVGDANNASRITQVTGTYAGTASPYYSAYKEMALDKSINNHFINCNNSFVLEWFNSLSKIESYQFTGRLLSASSPFLIEFPSVISIYEGGFAQPEIKGQEIKSNHYSFPLLTSIGLYAFYHHKQIVSITAPNVQTIGGNAFEGCTIVEVNFPNCRSVGNGAFRSCSQLISANFSSCTSIGYSAFYEATNLTTVSFPVCISIGARAFSSCYSKLTTANFPECTTMGEGAFYWCKSLQTISFPKLTVVPRSAFYACYALESVNMSLCTTIGSEAFANCSALSSAYFPECTIINSFGMASCKVLVNASFPKCVTVNYRAFTYDSALTSINLPKCTLVGQEAFSRCYALTTISLPICGSFSQYAFRECFNLLSLYLNSVSSVPIFGDLMFYSTPISNYTTSTGGVYGSIYVPASLFNSFKTATGWTAYSARMVSV